MVGIVKDVHAQVMLEEVAKRMGGSLTLRQKLLNPDFPDGTGNC